MVSHTISSNQTFTLLTIGHQQFPLQQMMKNEMLNQSKNVIVVFCQNVGQKGKSLSNESCARLNLTKTIWFDEILWVKFLFYVLSWLLKA